MVPGDSLNVYNLQDLWISLLRIVRTRRPKLSICGIFPLVAFVAFSLNSA
jgi:hypothetical protein